MGQSHHGQAAQDVLWMTRNRPFANGGMPNWAKPVQPSMTPMAIYQRKLKAERIRRATLAKARLLGKET